MKKVLLTGISGFLAQHCAVELLKEGYQVKGSLRNLSKQANVIKGISKKIDPQGNLSFCELDLLKDAGWDEAMEGCEFVLHIASPFIVREPKNEDELIKPAVEGTLRALKAAKKAGIKRIVITSSTVAMMGDAMDITLNQSSWTDEHSTSISAYMKSKVLAEKAAWEFINGQTDENQLEMTVVNPGPIYGPTLTNDLSGEAMSMFSQLITGKMPMLPKARTIMSDVRDVAKIHVLALENVAAKNKRFIVSSSEAYSFQYVAEILKSNGYSKVSTKLAPTLLLKFLSLFNSEIKGLMPFVDKTIAADISETEKVFHWKPIAIEKTALDTAASIEEALKLN